MHHVDQPPLAARPVPALILQPDSSLNSPSQPTATSGRRASRSAALSARACRPSVVEICWYPIRARRNAQCLRACSSRLNDRLEGDNHDASTSRRRPAHSSAMLCILSRRSWRSVCAAPRRGGESRRPSDSHLQVAARRAAACAASSQQLASLDVSSTPSPPSPVADRQDHPREPAAAADCSSPTPPPATSPAW